MLAGRSIKTTSHQADFTRSRPDEFCNSSVHVEFAGPEPGRIWALSVHIDILRRVGSFRRGARRPGKATMTGKKNGAMADLRSLVDLRGVCIAGASFR